MSALKPCPFCGSKAEKPFFYVGAMRTGCGDKTGKCAWSSVYIPVEDWNTRAPDPAVAALQAEVERLRAFASSWAYYQSMLGAFGERDDKVNDLHEKLISLGLNMEYPLPAPPKEVG